MLTKVFFRVLSSLFFFYLLPLASVMSLPLLGYVSVSDAGTKNPERSGEDVSPLIPKGLFSSDPFMKSCHSSGESPGSRDPGDSGALACWWLARVLSTVMDGWMEGSALGLLPEKDDFFDLFQPSVFSS